MAVLAWADERLVALGEEADNDSVKVSAVGKRMDLAERRLALLAAVGAIPAFDCWRWVLDATATARAMIDIAERHGLDLDELTEDLAQIEAARPALLAMNGSGTR